MCKAEQKRDRHIALAGFDPGDVALGNPRPARKLAPRQVMAEPHGAQPIAQLAEKLAFGMR